jgi:hypothetical protein
MSVPHIFVVNLLSFLYIYMLLSCILKDTYLNSPYFYYEGNLLNINDDVHN